MKAVCVRACWDGTRCWYFKPGDVAENMSPDSPLAVYFSDESGKPIAVKKPKEPLLKEEPEVKEVLEIGHVKRGPGRPPKEL